MAARDVLSQFIFNSLAPGRFRSGLEVLYSNALCRIATQAFAAKLSSGECHWTVLMKIHHRFRQWLGADGQSVVTCAWADVEPDLSRHMASLGHNELTGPCQYPLLALQGLIKTGKLHDQTTNCRLVTPYSEIYLGQPCSDNGWISDGTEPWP